MTQIQYELLAACLGEINRRLGEMHRDFGVLHDLLDEMFRPAVLPVDADYPDPVDEAYQALKDGEL